MEEQKRRKTEFVVDTLEVVQSPSLSVYRVTIDDGSDPWEKSWETPGRLAEFIRGYEAAFAVAAIILREGEVPPIRVSSRKTDIDHEVTVYFVVMGNRGPGVEAAFVARELCEAYLKGVEIGLRFAGCGDVPLPEIAPPKD